MQGNIYLIGFMGCGKSIMAGQLSKKFKKDALDLDKEIELTIGMTVSEIFDSKGEDYFRKLETEALIKTKNLNSIIACGGGAPCHSSNLDFMKRHGTTIYLKTSQDLLYDRLQKIKKNRPLIADLKSRELKSFIKTKLAEREKFYNKADYIINQEEEIAKMIFDLA